jgi:SAM-dependent methyltransferase
MQRKDVSDYYDAISSDYERKRFANRYYASVARKEEKFVAAHTDGPRVLEVGPGTGRFTRHLVQCAGTLTVCDTSERMLTRVRDSLGDVADIDYQQLAMENLTQLPNFGRYDTAIAMRVIPHIVDWRGAIISLHDAVRPGGVVIFDLWNNESFIGLVRKLFRRRSAVYTHRLRRVDIRDAVDSLNANVVATYRWGYPRVGALSLDELGSRVWPSAAYCTVFCCRTRLHTQE